MGDVLMFAHVFAYGQFVDNGRCGEIDFSGDITLPFTPYEGMVICLGDGAMYTKIERVRFGCKKSGDWWADITLEPCDEDGNTCDFEIGRHRCSFSSIVENYESMGLNFNQSQYLDEPSDGWKSADDGYNDHPFDFASSVETSHNLSPAP